MLFLMVTFLLGQAGALTDNLIRPSAATDRAKGWQPLVDATPEVFVGVSSLSVRHPGRWLQEVELAPAAAGTYAVLTGKGQSDRINLDRTITGQPHLYATVQSVDKRRILDYWQGQHMRALPENAVDWVKMWGIFKVPEGAGSVLVQLSQGERRGSPPDGSTARFADVRMYLFRTEAAAQAFVDHFVQRD